MSHLLRPLRRSGPVCTTCTRLLTASPTAGPSVCRSGVHTASQTSRGPSRRGPTNAQYAQARRARDDSGERKMDTSRVRFMAGRPAAPRSYMQNDRDADERPRTRGVGMRTVPGARLPSFSLPPGCALTGTVCDAQHRMSALSQPRSPNGSASRTPPSCPSGSGAGGERRTSTRSASRGTRPTVLGP
ncbi:hypothetical protein CALCODRAFT_120791 [Calocera cornea HHB12733]|uniref:Uncharacterized protein n=1 Tax=Calocera cornea HHB12733 TaxID=1353952 RepID=A0A165CZF8_9BASI|nr:hypothetical protein CALCODRAFT_120791 [Calocera cornea HHB12733]